MDTIFSNITLIFKSRLRRTNLCRRLFHFCAWCCYYFLRHQINLLSGLSWGEPLPLYWPSNLQKKPITGYYSNIITFITICILSIGYHISAVCAVDTVLQLYMSTPGLNPWCWHWIIKMGAKWSKHPGKWVNILLYTLFFRTYRNEILGSFYYRTDPKSCQPLTKLLDCFSVSQDKQMYILWSSGKMLFKQNC